jgi:hypothetical protein
MRKRHTHVLLSAVLSLSLAAFATGSLAMSTFAAFAQQSQTGSAPGVMAHGEAAKLMPATVFFAGKTAPVQARNTAGLRLTGGRLVLAALVDTSGYSSGVQSRYQAYFLTETPLRIEGKALPVGAYGCGFVAGKFLVLNLAGDVLFSVSATHDTVIRRPDPLQFIAASGGSYRLYSGRDYVTLQAAL